MARDYYETLGIGRNSSKEEIKQAYRRLARKYHPDVNKDPGAEERFKEINRAYEVLSDDEMRARFDRYGEAGINPGAAGVGGMGFDPSSMGGFADIFESFFGGMGATQQRSRTGPVRGDDLRYDLNLDFLEAVFGGDKQIRIKHLETCEICGGSGAKPGTSAKTCATCGGMGQVRRATRTPFGSFTQVSVCPTCHGTAQVIEEACNHCGGEGLAETTKKLRITIPAGVDSGTRLRVSSEGDAGRRGGPSGDLYVYLFVDADKEKIFQRDGVTILSEVKISYLQAILGGKVAIPTVDSRAELEPEVTLDIPAGSQPGTVLTLEGKGVPKVGNPVARGDHKVTVVVEIPTRLNHEERDLLVKLAELHGQKTGKGGGFLGGLFNFAHRDE